MALIRICEDDEQVAVIEWAELCTGAIPELAWLYHVPNGGYRNKIEAMKFKRMGVKSGVPDLVLPVARSGYHGLYIELKAKDGIVSEKQREWLNNLRHQGYFAIACFGADETISIIKNYLKGVL
ncbi:MAG: VRR-NUC domain-containing protein [Eubacteriales bacterium]